MYRRAPASVSFSTSAPPTGTLLRHYISSTDSRAQICEVADAARCHRIDARQPSFGCFPFTSHHILTSVAAVLKVTNADPRTLMHECLLMETALAVLSRPLLHRLMIHSHLSPHRAGFFRRLASARRIKLLLPNGHYHRHNLYSDASFR